MRSSRLAVLCPGSGYGPHHSPSLYKSSAMKIIRACSTGFSAAHDRLRYGIRRRKRLLADRCRTPIAFAVEQVEPLVGAHGSDSALPIAYQSNQLGRRSARGSSATMNDSGECATAGEHLTGTPRSFRFAVQHPLQAETFAVRRGPTLCRVPGFHVPGRPGLREQQGPLVRMP